MSRGWENFEMQIRKSLDCLEQTVGTNMEIKSDSGEGSQIKESYQKIYHCRKCTCHCEQNAGRNMNVKVSLGEVLAGQGTMS